VQNYIDHEGKYQKDLRCNSKLLKEWSALADDFRTFLLVDHGAESIFQQLTV